MAAYFRFVKWLFLVNLFTFLVILLVIIVPQGILEPDTFNDTMRDVKAGQPAKFILSFLSSRFLMVMVFRANHAHFVYEIEDCAYPPSPFPMCFCVYAPLFLYYTCTVA